MFMGRIVTAIALALTCAGIAGAQATEQVAIQETAALREQARGIARAWQYPTPEQLTRFTSALALYPEAANDREQVTKFCATQDGLPPLLYPDTGASYAVRILPNVCGKALDIALGRKETFFKEAMAFRSKHPRNVVIVIRTDGITLCRFDMKQPGKCDAWRKPPRKTTRIGTTASVRRKG